MSSVSINRRAVLPHRIGWRSDAKNSRNPVSKSTIVFDARSNMRCIAMRCTDISSWTWRLRRTREQLSNKIWNLTTHKVPRSWPKSWVRNGEVLKREPSLIGNHKMWALALHWTSERSSHEDIWPDRVNTDAIIRRTRNAARSALASVREAPRGSVEGRPKTEHR